MKVVLDTNAFISCIGKASPWRKVFDAFLRERYALCLSSEVLLEYEEKFEEFWGAGVTTNLLGRILTASNTSLHSIFYQFLLVDADADDNKFADLYLSAGADYLVTNDADLLTLRRRKYPFINVVTLQEFAELIIELRTFGPREGLQRKSFLPRQPLRGAKRLERKARPGGRAIIIHRVSACLGMRCLGFARHDGE